MLEQTSDKIRRQLNAMRLLTVERNAEIVKLRNEGLTLQAIADRTGLTRERVRQITAKANKASQ